MSMKAKRAAQQKGEEGTPQRYAARELKHIFDISLEAEDYEDIVQKTLEGNWKDQHLQQSRV